MAGGYFYGQDFAHTVADVKGVLDGKEVRYSSRWRKTRYYLLSDSSEAKSPTSVSDNAVCYLPRKDSGEQARYMLLALSFYYLSRICYGYGYGC
ncbi:MAG: hypothetical protein ACLU4N_10790 [Butyricimonas faecihominis]